ASLRLLAVTCVLSVLATPAFAANTINAADTGWMIVATGIVLMMTIPGLALFYAGMVRKKNILGTMAQAMAATALVSVLWILPGYSLAITRAQAVDGTFHSFFL